MTPDQVLDRAADAIDKYGHAKKSLRNGDGALCAMGAMNWVLYGDANWIRGPAHESDLPAYMTLMAAVGPVVDWNNAPDRTHDEITSTMRAVAAIMRAKSSTTAMDIRKLQCAEVSL